MEENHSSCYIPVYIIIWFHFEGGVGLCQVALPHTWEGRTGGSKVVKGK